MKKPPLQIFLAFVCLLFSLNHAAFGMNDDKPKEIPTGIKFSSLDTIHSSMHSSISSGLEFSETNDPERTGKLSWVIDPNEFAQLGSLYQSIYEDDISCWSLDKINSIRIDLHGKSVEDAKKSVIDLIYRCHTSKEATSIHFICGHGKHKNSKGDRGTLFKNFPEWLKEEAIVHLIKSCHSTLGAYDVVLNSNGSSERPETEKKVLKVSFIELIAMHGDALGQYILGRMYLSGDRVKKDEKLAAHWLRESANQGRDDAQLLLGYLCAMGKGTRYNPQEAFSWYSKAEAQGNEGAMLNIATMYFTGEGIGRNYAKAVKYYLEAAKKGSPKAMNMLGIMYRHGYGVERDDEEAVRWDRKGAEAGSPHAKVNLGVMLLVGRGVQRNPTEAVKWLREGADYALAEGHLWLGRAYEHGDGVEQDYLEAFKCYTRAALQKAGSPSDDANYYIGQLYEGGNGVKKDFMLANLAYLRAAKNGHSKSEAELGHHYRHGLGFDQDYGEAVKWYRIAAKKGNPGAQYGLGEMYMSGWGVPRNEKIGMNLMQKSIERRIRSPGFRVWLEEAFNSQNAFSEVKNGNKVEVLMAQEATENNKLKEVEENERSEAPKLLPVVEEAKEQEVMVKGLVAAKQTFPIKSSCLYYGAVVVTLILILHYMVIG